MEKIAEVLLKLESKDAVAVANKYINFKYVEHFTATFLVVGMLITSYFVVRSFIRNM